ncbi:MAG TPA: hypothetical protein VJM09_04495 [Sphingobium sp.]|nr:hypothetical protein [Sphingobium sp.]
MKDRLKKINWWALVIIALQGIILWRLADVQAAADDAGGQAYDAYVQAQAAVAGLDEVKQKLPVY